MPRWFKSGNWLVDQLSWWCQFKQTYDTCRDLTLIGGYNSAAGNRIRKGYTSETYEKEIIEYATRNFGPKVAATVAFQMSLTEFKNPSDVVIELQKLLIPSYLEFCRKFYPEDDVVAMTLPDDLSAG